MGSRGQLLVYNARHITKCLKHLIAIICNLHSGSIRPAETSCSRSQFSFPQILVVWDVFPNVFERIRNKSNPSINKYGVGISEIRSYKWAIWHKVSSIWIWRRNAIHVEERWLVNSSKCSKAAHACICRSVSIASRDDYVYVSIDPTYHFCDRKMGIDFLPFHM